MTQSKHNPTSHCFSSILGRFVCGRNLPTHSTPPNPKTLEPSYKVATFSNPLKESHDPNNDQVRVQVQAQASQGPGIVARLMGLDSLPAINLCDSLYRSKSLNSLHFLPDFDPTRASFHRRARTSTSYHEQGHNKFLFTIDEDNIEQNGLAAKKSDMGIKDLRHKKEKKENVVILKGNEGRKSRKHVTKKRCEKSFTDKNLKEVNKRKFGKERKMNVNVGSSVYSKGMVEDKNDGNVELQSDAMSRSPVSVLDDLHVFGSPSSSIASERLVTSNSGRKSSPKIKLYDELTQQDMKTKSKKNYEEGSNKKIENQQKIVRSEGEVADYFVDLMGQISKVVEENIRDPKWMIKHERCMTYYSEKLSIDFAQQMLDFLLYELLHEFII